MIKNLREMDLLLFKAIRRLYQENPLRHCFLFHNVVFETELCEAVFHIRESNIFSYAMLYRGHLDQTHLHLYGNLNEIEEQVEYWLRRFRRVKVISYSEAARKKVEGMLPKLSARFSSRRIIDMVTDELAFNEKADVDEPVKMSPAYCTYDVLDLYRSLGFEKVAPQDVSRLLAHRRCYGYFDRSRRLTAMACRYVSLPEVWVVGELLMRPEAERRHIASVIYAVARDGVKGGARVLLLVDEGNEEVKSIARYLGFREIGIRTRIDVETPTSALLSLGRG
ncbi:MAG: hypothetical protein GXO32_03915 [Crenarchaeota archaeon]|nr:hypothetical protein [Thermoproteota archaeon]